jgi:hypothetical protein
LEWKLQQSKQVSATSSFFLRRWNNQIQIN